MFIGMVGGNDVDKFFYFEQEVDKVSVIFDVVVLLFVMLLICYVCECGKIVIIGFEVFDIQVVE